MNQLIGTIRFPNLNIVLEHVGKEITILGFSIHFYGIIIALGFLAGLAMAMHEAKRTEQNPEDYLDYMLWMVIPAIIGARLYYVIFSWEDYKDNLLSIFAVRQGGLAIYGGVIAAVLVLIIFCKIRRKSFFLMADTMVMGLLIGQIMGRWGNFFNREAFGGYTDGLFAMQIPIADASYTTPELLQKAVTIGGIDYIQVQPTFLYEGLWNLAVLLLIFFFWRKKKKFDGELLCVYLAGYGLGRCWIEGMRTDQLLLGSTSIPVSQVLAGVLAIIGISVIVVKRIRMRKTGLSFRK
ncbi:MAG TPA: prolipoprotein diacylglyceryl transferase [Lachnospiraceae bacterium]|nr:prolipoprotein diacylglyceryl transferase [Lachnospiraceae bacterium]HIS61179.1 prolipoprotein diacylglyceryl transferase [Candidatus Scybalomonas excrementigallinarum]